MTDFLLGFLAGLGLWAAAEWWRNPVGARGRKLPVAYHAESRNFTDYSGDLSRGREPCATGTMVGYVCSRGGIGCPLLHMEDAGPFKTRVIPLRSR